MQDATKVLACTLINFVFNLLIIGAVYSLLAFLAIRGARK